MRGHRATARSWTRLAWLWPVLLVGVGAGEAPAGGPGRPPSQMLPARGLTSYLEYDGLDAHRAAWNATAARAILVDQSAGPALAEVERRLLDRILRASLPGGKLTAADLLAFQDHLVARGLALATYEDDGESSSAFVLRGFDGKECLARFESIARLPLRMAPDAGFPAPARSRGRDLHGPGRGDADGVTPARWTWWQEGDALILVTGPSAGRFDLLRPGREDKDLGALHRSRVSAVLDAIESARPNVATHPAYAAATAEGRDLKGFEPDGLFFAEAREGRGVLARMSEGVRASQGASKSDEFTFSDFLDLNRATRIVGRWGFRGKSLVTDVRFECPDAWRGPLRRGGLRKDRLPPIPRGMGAFAVGSLDWGRIVERSGPLRAAAIPEALAVVTALDQVLRDGTTAGQRADVFRRLGPAWCIYASPGGKDVPTVPTLLVEVRDADGLDRALGAMAAGLNDRLRVEAGDAKPPSLERLPAPERGYRLAAPAGLVPWLSGDIQPTILLGTSSLVVAASPALAREAIAAESDRGRRRGPDGELATSFEALPDDLALLVVGNPGDSDWPEGLAGLPRSVGPFLGAFLGVDLADDRAPGLLGALGVRRNEVRPARADELRSLIHPSVFAVTVDGRGVRAISLEALPLACLGIVYETRPGAGVRPMTIGVKFGPGR